MASLKRQTYTSLEIIVMDSSSTDRTVEIANSFGVILIENKFEGLRRGFDDRTFKRNMGARMAKGEFLYFIDSDFELGPTVIEDCVRICDAGADAVIVPEHVAGDKGYWSRCRQLEVLCYNGDDQVESPRFLKRSVFFAVGGYDPSIAAFGEDNELCNRVRNAGFRISRTTSFLYHHEGRVGRVVMRKFYYGGSALTYVRKRRSVALAQFSFIRVGWIKNRRLLAQYPQYAFGMMVLETAKYMAAGLGALAGLGSAIRSPKGSGGEIPSTPGST